MGDVDGSSVGSFVGDLEGLDVGPLFVHKTRFADHYLHITHNISHLYILYRIHTEKDLLRWKE